MSNNFTAGPPLTDIVYNLLKLLGAVSLLDANNTFFPSFVQPLATLALACQVNLLASPPVIGTIYTVTVPDLFDENAIHFPLGDKCGLPSFAGVLVNLVVRLLAKLVVQISPAYAKATWFPLIVGSLNNLVSCAEMAAVVTNNAKTVILVKNKFIVFKFFLAALNIQHIEIQFY